LGLGTTTAAANLFKHYENIRGNLYNWSIV